MAKMIMEQTVAIVLVITMGMLPSRIPWTTKSTEPSPNIRKVGMAMPSVSRVRIVAIACGR